MRRIGVIALAILFMAGCQEVRKEQMGAVVGGVLGGVLGNRAGRGENRAAEVIAGTLIGAWLGGKVGAGMDQTDRGQMKDALESQKSGVAHDWVNPDTGARYQMTPLNAYNDPASSAPCREYVMEAVIDGKREQVKGAACRDANGNWRVSG